MSEQAVKVSAPRGWLITPEAARNLTREIWRIRRDISALAGDGLEEGVSHLALAQAVRRLESLQATERHADLLDDRDCAAIGRRATVRLADGDVVCYTIVFPGDGDPSRDCISADSPLGSALLGARPGATVEVAAPAGTWSVVVLAVE
jgi:transcription elongation GreA/GreB family factor